MRTLRWAAAAYVLVVAATAAVGFVHESTPTILLAAALSLPASLVALPAYYLAYGVLAAATHATRSTASGATTCTAAGECTSSTSGDPATWFQLTTDALGIFALAGAAVLTARVIIAVVERHRRRAAVKAELR